MTKNQRILFNSGNTDNTYIKINLEQQVETLEFLSLSLTSDNIYQSFNSDYGVLIGRVIANDNVGIPNAKISIFIPISENDINNDELFSIYPYKNPRDKNNEGKRYNLLPRVSRLDPITNIKKPKQAFGSFPTKEEIVTNDVLFEVYEKYYKYTTVTNESGDYMIFGVPIGVQTVHMSVDITDIGDYSMNPASIISELGYPSNYFTSDRKNIKNSSDLKDLPNIETQDISVNIIPFWGDKENFEIGITRQDFRIRTTIKSYFVLFGSAFTDGFNGYWGSNSHGEFARIGELYSAASYNQTVNISGKRNGIINEKIYYFPDEIFDIDILTGDNIETNNIVLLDKSEYISYKKNGDFIFIIPCNRTKIITNDIGETTNVQGDYDGGIFTEFRGFITLEMDNSINEEPIKIDNTQQVYIKPYRLRFKFPQHGFELINKKNTGLYSEYNGLDLNLTNDGYVDFANNRTKNWRIENKLFCMNKFYTTAKFHPIIGNSSNHIDSSQDIPSSDLNIGFLNKTCINEFHSFNDDVGVITTESTTYQYPSNYVYGNGQTNLDINKPAFGVNWMNIGIHFPQLTKVICNVDELKYVNTSDYGSMQTSTIADNTLKNNFNSYFVNENEQIIGGSGFDTSCFGRPDIHWTDIVEIPIQDIYTMQNIKTNGFCKTPNNTHGLIGSEYRNAIYRPLTQIPNGFTDNDIANLWYCATPYGCRVYNNVNCYSDGSSTQGNGDINTTYFYKGFGESNVINYLYELNLV